MEVTIIGNIQPENPHHSQNVYGGAIAPNIMAGTHGYGMGYITEIKKMENEGCRKLFDLPEGVINDLECHRRVYSTDACTPTLNARHDSTKILEINNLTMTEGETECLRAEQSRAEQSRAA